MTTAQWSGTWGGLGALVIVLLFQTWLVQMARRRVKTSRKVHFMDLVVTCDDESYSLSRLQIYLWTVAIIVGFSAVFVATGKIPVISESLYMLMGINIASAVTSNAIRTAKNLQRNLGAPPDFIKDIFFDNFNSLDLPRTQMAVWTIISLIVYFVMLTKSFYGQPEPALPDITNGLSILMGLSNGAYLGAKATDPAISKEPADATSKIMVQTFPPKIPPFIPKQ